MTLATFGYPVRDRWYPWIQRLELFGFPIFWLWANPMKVIPETRRAH